MRRRLLALALLPVLGGCATKRDLRDLRTEVESARAAQDAMLREIQRQNALILDTVEAQDVRMRGDLTAQLVRLERQLVQVQELSGQGQQQLAAIRGELRAREEALRNAQAGGTADAPAGDPDELLGTARAALERGSFSTARAGFEEFVRAFPQHPQAADAQLGVGETFEKANDLPRALEAYSRVLELYPDATAAPTALYRAAMIEVGRNNRDRARTMLNQLTAAYPRSPEAPRAREQLQRIRR
jgi:tol-pal system protein YbgF